MTSSAHSNLVDDDHYAQAFAAFLRRLDYPDALFGWLDQRFQHNGARSLLCIGAGTGSVELPMLERMSELVRVDMIEPNPAHADALERALLDHPRLSSQVHRTVYEQWSPPAGSAHDVILFCNSLYFLPTPGRMLGRALTQLAPGGQLLIIHEHPMGAMYRIQTRYHETTQTTAGRAVYYTAADILDDLLSLQTDPASGIDVLDVRLEVEHATLDVRDYPRPVLEFLFETAIRTDADYRAKVAFIRSMYASTRLPQPYSVITVTRPASSGARPGLTAEQSPPVHRGLGLGAR